MIYESYKLHTLLYNLSAISLDYYCIIILKGSITYQIPAEGVTWSSLFKTVEENKENLRIIDYSVSQTTLDQVSV